MASSVLLLFLLSGLTPFLAAADVSCDNLKIMAATLSKNISSSPVFFATTITGQAPDIVYALGFCRGDVLNNSACGECIANTFDALPKPTPPPYQQCYQAVYCYGDPCTLLYSTDNILVPSNTTAGNGDDVPFERWNVQNFTGDVRRITGLIHRLLVETVEKAASTAPRRFSTGVVDGGGAFPPVYSLAQCTPDLSAGECLECLRRLLGMLNSTMSLRMGGQIHVMRCYFRYDPYSFYDGQPVIRLQASAPAPTDRTKPTRRMSKLWVIPIVVVPLAAVAVLCFIFYSRCLTRQREGSRSLHDLEGEERPFWQGKNSEFSVFTFEQIQEAADYFSEQNKLGQGGFGAVYKGQFHEGLEVAVKRLASHSGQGFIEFKNEVQLIAKLQHMNLVRLLGCCSQEEEKILVYEYLPNKSLDWFIFDENKRALLDWSKLSAIIKGIAHGLLYLHKHSRLHVIHRDLKPSNILLDSEMNPKISDFGLARIFSSHNTEGNTTRRVVGTYGYMAPEYASKGIFSIKSDVFSFGVVILEILSGKRNSRTQQCGNFINLLGYAWHLWEEERWIDLVDASLIPSNHLAEMMRCINIALLCVQESASDRPTMADVVAMLSIETMIMTKPKQPAYFNLSVGNEDAFSARESCSINDVTISMTTPR